MFLLNRPYVVMGKLGEHNGQSLIRSCVGNIFQECSRGLEQPGGRCWFQRINPAGTHPARYSSLFTSLYLRASIPQVGYPPHTSGLRASLERV